MKKILWALKQLIPLTYWSTYESGGEKYFSIWRMWFGRCFDITKFSV